PGRGRPADEPAGEPPGSAGVFRAGGGLLSPTRRWRAGVVPDDLHRAGKLRKDPGGGPWHSERAALPEPDRGRMRARGYDPAVLASKTDLTIQHIGGHRPAAFHRPSHGQVASRSYEFTCSNPRQADAKHAGAAQELRTSLPAGGAG